MTEEITYIPYGQNEISRQDLMTSLSNGLPGFMDQYRWLKKPNNRKEFLEIYSNMVKGLVNASDSSGLWEINSTYDTSNLSPLGKEMAGHAAYYIQQQMSRMTPRKKEEEAKKEEQAKKNKFNGEVFENDLAQYIGNKEYGGRKIETWLPDWLERDTAENNIYGTAKRQEALANFLQSYRDQFKKDDYNFEESPYGSYEEFNNRLEAAVKALKNPEWNQEDKDALNRLGLNREVWLATGANAPVEITDSKGNKKTITREQYNALVAEQEAAVAAAKIKEEQEKQEAKQKEEAAKKLEAINKMRAAASKYKSMLATSAPKPFGIAEFADISEIKSEKDIVPYLRKQLENVKTTSDYRNKSNLIHGAYKYAFDNKLLKPISEETWQALRRMKGSERYEGGRKYLHQIEGINNVIYNSYLNKIIFLGEDNQTTKDAIQNYRKKKYFNGNHYQGPYSVAGFQQGGTIDNLDKIIEDFLNSK